MPKIQKTKSGRYCARMYDKSTKKQKMFTADTKAELRRMMADYEVNKHLNRNDINVKEAIERYISNRSAVCSPATIYGYRVLQEKHYKEIGVYSLYRLTNEIVQQQVNKWAATLSPKSVKNIYGLFIAAVNEIMPEKVIKVTLPQKKVIEYHVPTEAQVKELINASSDYLRKAILLASAGTMRRGEICALTYEDINRETNQVHVHADMVRTPEKTYTIKEIPKTSASDRFIDYPKAVIDEIGEGSGRIIPVNPDTLTKSFEKLRKKVGLDCRFHDLRHYAASIMHAIGIPDSYIQKVGGWKTDNVLKSVYRNTLSDQERIFAEKANGYMENLL